METNAPIPRYYLYGRLDDDAGEVEIDFLHQGKGEAELADEIR